MLNERMVVPEIRVYKNNYYFKILPKSNIKIKKPRKLDKVLVFDLDETLGSFHQLVILWNLLDVNKNQNTFNILLDLYPEFMREGILKILKYIIKKKKKGECDKLYIYTNSIYSPEIPNLLTKYFQYKLKEETIIFDKVISAFKINNKIIETGRTTNNKTHDDFIQCALLPEKTEICFIDDSYHEKMNHEKVYYIQPSPYFYYLTVDTIVKRFINSKLYTNSFDETQLYNIINDGHYIIPFPQNNDQHKKVFQKMIYYIKDFFYLTQQKTKTRKLRTHIGNFTRKRIINSRMPLR